MSDEYKNIAEMLINELHEQGLIKDTENAPKKIMKIILGTISAINDRLEAIELKVGIVSPRIKQEMAMGNKSYTSEETKKLFIDYVYDNVKLNYPNLTNEELESLKDRLSRIKTTDTLENINFVINSIVHRGEIITFLCRIEIKV